MGLGVGGNFREVEIKIRRMSSAQWTSLNPVLPDGEPGYETDQRGLKIGNGNLPWVSLPYFGGFIATGTVSSVSASISGALAVTGTPITTSGTLAFAWQGGSSQYVLGDGSLASIPSLSGYIPYTGANAPANLNTQALIAGATTFSGISNIGNATTSNQRQLRIGQGTATIDIGSYAPFGSIATIYMNEPDPVTNPNNGTIVVDGTGSTSFAGRGVFVRTRFNNIDVIYSDATRNSFVNSQNYFDQGAIATSGTITNFGITTPRNTGQTASTNISGININPVGRQWANGAIALQEEILIQSPVYSHVSGSNTITTAATLNVYAPTTTGGFTTIINNFSMISNGNIKVLGNIGTDTVTGMIVGVTNLQKVSFWGNTPIVQPTQAGTSAVATYNLNGGNNLTDSDTFGTSLWTWPKFIQAIFNTGLLKL